MIKKLVEHVFQAHQLDVLRKLLGAIESAASQNGWTQRDESICDFIARATKANRDIEKESQGIAYYRELVEAYHAVSGEHGREDGELIEDYMVRIWEALDVAQRYADDIQKKLQEACKSIEEKDSEIGKLISLSKERALEMTKLKESHSATSDGLSILQIENLKRQLQTAKDDLERQHIRETKISAEYQADIKKILTTANKLGRADYESPEAFMNRQAADMESQARQLNLVRQELGDKTQKLLELSRWHEENLEKIKGLEAQLAHETARLKAAIRSDEIYAKECGRFDGESLRSFIGRIVGDNIHMRDELSAANQRMQIEKMKELEEVVAAVTADRDRIRTELAAILAEANKSGRCNGDPVQLLKQGQADLDALIRLETDKANLLGRMDNLETQLKAANAAALSAEEHAERATFSENESAKLNALVSKLQGELATARDQAGVAQHECSIWNNAATRAGQTLTKLGKLQDENEAQFIERMQGAEFNREEQLKNALAAKNKAQSEDDESHRRFMNLIRMADSCGRLRGESVEQFVARQDQLRVSNMEQRDEARFEVERLSALVAELQVELDDARGQYGGIMAQLGNETPLQLIERMQRLAQDRRASTIPHDERAMLVAESADLRKRLEASQKAHAKTEHELGGKLRAALATVENQSAAIAEAKQATEKYTAVVEAADKLKEWASTIRHKVLVAMVHTKAMAEYDTIMKELDGKAGTDGC